MVSEFKEVNMFPEKKKTMEDKIVELMNDNKLNLLIGAVKSVREKFIKEEKRRGTNRNCSYPTRSIMKEVIDEIYKDDCDIDLMVRVEKVISKKEGGERLFQKKVAIVLNKLNRRVHESRGTVKSDGRGRFVEQSLPMGDR